MQRFFGFADEDFGKTFAVLIQFGAILALLSIYFMRLWKLALGMFHRSGGAALRHRRPAGVPAGGGGRRASRMTSSRTCCSTSGSICFTLIAGGAVLLWIDMLDLKPRYHDAQKFTLPMYFMIGVVPVPCHGAGRVALRRDHRVGAMLLGADRRSAAEFSFWLAMPTMAGAFAYDLYKSHGQMSSGNPMLIAVGFAVSFVCAWIVVKTFLGYVQRHGFCAVRVVARAWSARSA